MEIILMLMIPFFIYIFWQGIDALEKREEQMDEEYKLREKMDYWE